MERLYFCMTVIKYVSSIRSLKGCLYGANLFYARKPIYLLIDIWQLLYFVGCRIETASKGENQTALKVGILSLYIIYNSSGKATEKIDFAIEEKIKFISVESFEKAELINKMTKK